MAAAPYLLDTNAYTLIFQHPKPPGLERLEVKLKTNQELSFYLPQIASLEIHSVLGRFRRGGNALQHLPCERHVLFANERIKCTHTCVFAERKRMRLKVFRDLQKLIKDIEEQRGSIKATILPIGPAQLVLAKALLIGCCDRFDFGFHDAIVAASAINARNTGTPLTVVTSDRGLKALCGENAIPVFDPLLD
jgi:hypothetical protein